MARRPLLEDCTNDELLAEVVRRCERPLRDDPLDSEALTRAVYNHIDYNDPDVLEGIQEAKWEYRNIVGEDGIADILELYGDRRTLLQLIQKLTRPRRPEDYAHALSEADALLSNEAIYGPFDAQVTLL